MKRILVILLAAITLFMMGCGGNPPLSPTPSVETAPPPPTLAPEPTPTQEPIMHEMNDFAHKRNLIDTPFGLAKILGNGGIEIEEKSDEEKITFKKYSIEPQNIERISNMGFYALDYEGNVYAVDSLEKTDNGTLKLNGLQKIEGLTGIIHIIATIYIDTAVFVLDKYGCVWAWGDNRCGQLGDGTTERRAEPKKIEIPAKIVDIAISPVSAVALDERGNIWYWGGKIGDADYGDTTLPAKIDVPGKVLMIGCAYGSVYIITDDYCLYEWGISNYTDDYDNGNSFHTLFEELRLKDFSINYDGAASLLTDTGKAYAFGFHVDSKEVPRMDPKLNDIKELSENADFEHVYTTKSNIAFESKDGTIVYYYQSDEEIPPNVGIG